MEYFTFPMETLNVTQTYLGKTSHYPHTTGDPKDYPIDVAGFDGSQSAIFATVQLKVVAKKGIGNTSVTNTVWLESVDKVITPTFNDIAWMTLTHWNDGDTAMKKWEVGSVIPKGSIICYEGKDGSTSNHIHLVCGRGHCDGWVENTDSKWVMNGNSIPPEDVLYIDNSFTKVNKSGGNLAWKSIPSYIGTPVNRDVTKNQIEVIVKLLNIRTDHFSNSASLGYINLGIYDYLDSFKDDIYTWYKIENGWIATNGEWLKVMPKEEILIPEKPVNCTEKLSVLEEEIIILQQETKQLQASLLEKETTITSLQEEIISLESGTKEWNQLSIFKAKSEGYYYIKLLANQELIFKIIQ